MVIISLDTMNIPGADICFRTQLFLPGSLVARHCPHMGFLPFID